MGWNILLKRESEVVFTANLLVNNIALPCCMIIFNYYITSVAVSIIRLTVYPSLQRLCLFAPKTSSNISREINWRQLHSTRARIVMILIFHNHNAV